jgi:hypothetical protein
VATLKIDPPRLQPHLSGRALTKRESAAVLMDEVLGLLCTRPDDLQLPIAKEHAGGRAVLAHVFTDLPAGLVGCRGQVLGAGPGSSSGDLDRHVLCILAPRRGSFYVRRTAEQRIPRRGVEEYSDRRRAALACAGPD